MSLTEFEELSVKRINRYIDMVAAQQERDRAAITAAKNTNNTNR